jgi:hypothetical protein
MNFWLKSVKQRYCRVNTQVKVLTRDRRQSENDACSGGAGNGIQSQKQLEQKQQRN